ncbi:MAG: XRE family transcriptional regulator [Candidatus Paceibacterota bacterium]|jgi:Zn-dependent peptidase ImmA (M78 family)
MTTLNLQPNGEVIRWARETSRKSIAEIAADLDATPSEIRSWEANSAPVRLTQLKKLGSLYQRPIAFFFAPVPPTEELITPAFRTFDSVKLDSLSEKTLIALRKSKENRDLYKFLLEELEEKYSFNFPITSINDDADQFADKVRKYLGISDNIHERFKDKYVALKFWIALVEQHGLLVFQYSLPERGFCLSGNEDLPPTIVMNSGEYPAGRIFTIFHELCHLLLKEKSESISHTRLEEYCNHFAGAFLVSKRKLMESKNREKFLLEMSDFWLGRLAGEFKVSHEVVLRRLLILKDITQSFYNQKIAELKKIQQRRKEESETSENSGFIAPARKALMNVGVTMASKLFQARDAGVISTATLVRSFDTTSHSLKNVGTELASAKNLKLE